MVTKRVLVIAKTESSPSSKYGSTVCTAGITDEGEFIRLYPIPYRLFCNNDTNIRRYDWIECECAPPDSDTRRESYKVDADSIEIVGHVGTKNGWAERNSLILKNVSRNFDELRASGASLGIIKPSEILDFTNDPIEKDGSDESEILAGYRKTLQMIFDSEGGFQRIPSIEPMKTHFRYHFKCPGDDTIHRMLCEDWEVYQSSRSWIASYGTPEKTWEMMYEKFFTLFTQQKDLHFFVGTHSRFKTWMIIGLYYPPKTGSRQTVLFDTA